MMDNMFCRYSRTFAFVTLLASSCFCIWNFCTDFKDFVTNWLDLVTLKCSHLSSTYGLVLKYFAHIAFDVFLKLEHLMR